VKRLLLLILSFTVASVSASQFKAAQVTTPNISERFVTTEQYDAISQDERSWTTNTSMSLDLIRIVELTLKPLEQAPTAHITMTEVVFRISQKPAERPTIGQQLAVQSTNFKTVNLIHQTAQPVLNNTIAALNNSEYSANAFNQNEQIQLPSQPLNYMLPAVPSLLESSMNAKPQVMF
jgi:hypothetical protein